MDETHGESQKDEWVEFRGAGAPDPGDPSDEPPPGISAVRPLGPAFGWMGSYLFDRFSIVNWIVTAFIVWVATLYEGGTGWVDASTGIADMVRNGFADFQLWFVNNLMLATFAMVAGIALVVGVTAVVIWVRSRFKLILVDALAQRAWRIREPWRRYRDPANSLAKVSFIVLTAGFLSVTALWILLTALFIPANMRNADQAAVIAIVVGVLVTALIASIVKTIGLVLEHFVVPDLYLREGTAMDGLRRFRTEILPGRLLLLTWFLVVRTGLHVVIWMASTAVGILTCCIGFLPFVSTVLVLPLLLADRLHGLFYIQQFGPQWQVIGIDRRSPLCPGCGYDLRESLHSAACPECGRPIPPEIRDTA